MNTKNRVFVGPKGVESYLPACFFVLNDDKFDDLIISGRGNNVKRCIDVASILLRQYLDVPNKLPTYDNVISEIKDGNYKEAIDMLENLKLCEFIIDSEKFKDRHVSTLDIIIRGKMKDGEKESVQTED